ncbi:hypothetical protein HMPREF1219_00118 [Corynebacterium pyruviciproducens ATCC BAA-1742]|uniref:IrrE N-terminal-like domain-containing protein n=1 Tax=Corynebacterium pyruviciproducens ATCC BAA-1742 TaxID=1125779 RepID=S2Z266_9CORY|nr:ImmA/IrrE family metallo-endopeptidase [Corynebacterium pyruviciproducens]EPD70823.1 hypothetical protein HMPREF1219_00118 [Corynebacterium pyruviciproducens ATCC BAA-1742]
MIDALIATAERRGYRVAWHRGGPKAAWMPPVTISLRLGMSDTQTLCALAHELGHAVHGDPPGHTGACERRADLFAARLLIDPDEYRRAEAIYGTAPARLAEELGVTQHLLCVWKTIFERTKINVR